MTTVTEMREAMQTRLRPVQFLFGVLIVGVAVFAVVAAVVVQSTGGGLMAQEQPAPAPSAADRPSGESPGESEPIAVPTGEEATPASSAEEMPALPILTIAGAVGGVGILMMAWMLRTTQLQQIPRVETRSDNSAAGAESAADSPSVDQTAAVAALMQRYTSIILVSGFMLEGAAILNIVAHLLEGHPASLGLAAAMLAVLALSMPTYRRTESWLADKLGDPAGFRHSEYATP